MRSHHLLNLAFLFLLQPAYAEVLFVSDSGFVIENKIQTEQSPADAWAVFIDQVDEWWPKDHTWWGEEGALSISAMAGGCFCETSGDRSAEHMHIAFVDPQRLLRMTGGLGPLQGLGMYGSLDWAFSAGSEGTEITLTYRVQGNYPDGFAELAPIVDSVQGLQLNGLANALDSLD
jgi:hypothetical protein